MKRAVRPEVWKRAQTGHLETWVGYAAKGGASAPERAASWGTLLKAVEAGAPIKEGERVLDIGCGLDTVLEFVPRTERYTLDPLASDLGPLGLAKGILHVGGVFETAPFPDGTFDRVFIMNVLDHVRAPVEGLAEISRILRPGGTLVLSVDTFSGRKYLEKRFHKWWGRIRGARTKHPWIFSIPDVERLLRANALEPAPPTHVTGTKARRTFFLARRVA
ncbi:MAG: class I SAM-dependent methyltransferase [Myxococcota bacterium]